MVGNSHRQKSPFDTAGKSLTYRSRNNIRRNIETFFGDKCRMTLQKYQMTDYPSDDIEFNTSFFKELQHEYLQSCNVESENQKLIQQQRIAVLQKQKQVARESGIASVNRNEFDPMTHSNSIGVSKRFGSGTGAVDKILSFSKLQFTKNTVQRTSYDDNSSKVNDALMYESPITSNKRHSGSSREDTTSSITTSTPPVVAAPSVAAVVDDARTIKIQGEVIALLKCKESYVSEQAFESVKGVVVDYLGSIEALNETTIIFLSKDDFIPKDESKTLLKKGVAKMLEVANFNFV